VEIVAGDKFDFNATYCNITCSAKKPVALEHVGADDVLGTHPAYQAFGLESYIGVPIKVYGELYGTLNFSSPNPFHRQFKEIDIDVLQLMSSWVELTRRDQEAQLQALNEKLKLKADYDALTKTLNRRGMFKRLHKSLNQLNRTMGKGTLAIIDIDHFKKLNDSYGHQMGDKALLEIAQSIAHSLRDYEFVARYGGEEFLLWLPDTDKSGCETVCQRIMRNIRELKLTPEPITVSIGACHFSLSGKSPVDLPDLIDELIAKADSAMYSAKAEGRNKLISFENRTLDF
jgi:diguanylate cyclase (GGDEF)-like protein